MNRLIAPTAVCILFGIAFNVNAALIHWGAEARTSVANCPGFCTDFSFGPSLGGENVTISGTSSIADTRGSAMASAALSGGISTPVLKAQSEANSGFKGAFATAFAVQGYTYNGVGEILTLDVSLDGLVNDPEMDPTDTSVTLEVVLYQSDPFGFYMDRGTLDYEVGAVPLKQPDTSEASVKLQLDHTNTMTDSGQINVDVSNGDEFYIWAYMRAISQSGSNATSADAFNTGTIDFQGAPDLTPAASSVPLPAAAWLFGSGLIGLIGIARRKKT